MDFASSKQDKVESWLVGCLGFVAKSFMVPNNFGML